MCRVSNYKKETTERLEHWFGEEEEELDSLAKTHIIFLIIPPSHGWVRSFSNTHTYMCILQVYAIIYVHCVCVNCNVCMDGKDQIFMHKLDHTCMNYYIE